MELLIKQLEVYLNSIEEIKEELEDNGYDTSGMDLFISGLSDEIEGLSEQIIKN